MVIKKISFVITLLFISNLVCAQEYSFKNYTWSEKPEALEIPEQFKSENEIILSKKNKIEIIVDKNGAKQYYLLHDRIFINSDDAIEKNNKIYLPMGQNVNVIKNEARVILKNGKIITLNKKDIKEEIDEERNLKFNYFAVNGLEKGAIIEKVFILEEFPTLNGKTFRMQSDIPIVQANFELIYPKHLVFKTKVYNGLSEPIFDTETSETSTKLTINEKNIEALPDDEKYSNWRSKIKYLSYKLDQNLYSGAKNLYNFKEFSSNIYERFYTTLDKKDTKTVADFCKSIAKNNNQQEQLWNIEDKIKKSITYNRYYDSKETITDIIKSKQASQGDILRLYIAVLNQFNIESQIVFASDRFDTPFDIEFESYENLDEILLYFPSINKFLTPTEIEYRIPLIPANLANNHGLFIKSKEFAGIKMGIGEKGFITIPGVELTHDTMEITVDFTKDLENPIITTNLTYGGYSGLNFQPMKDFISEEQYKDILKSIAQNYTGEKQPTTIKSKNDGLENIGKKPFHLDLTFEGSDLIQKAGNTYLFSIGKTIGSQMELYQEHKRKLPVEIDYPHSYYRKIIIKLPENIVVKNLENFNMDYKTEINGKTEAGFVSSYKQNKNEIIIENNEFYNIINYPLEHFDSYKDVINAAADFNKITLVLNK